MEQEDVFDTPRQNIEDESTVSLIPERIAKERATEHIVNLLEKQREPYTGIWTEAEVEE